MKPENHRLRAEALESQVPLLTDPSAIIEICWGAAYQWICYGCDRKHGRHPLTHTGVVKYLKDLGELERSSRWAAMEGVRVGGFYDTKAHDVDVALARQILQEFRTWALSSKLPIKFGLFHGWTNRRPISCGQQSPWLLRAEPI